MVAIASAGAVILVLFIRFLGWLQPLELLAYDLLLSRRPPEARDENVVIVGVTGIRSSGESISDGQLLKLLKQLQAHNNNEQV